MAFVSTNSNIRASILGFIKHLVSKSLYRAIEILLKPCCDISATGNAVCSNINRFTLTITLDKPLPAFPAPYDIAIFAVHSAVSNVTYIPGSTTITTSLTFVGGGITNYTEDVYVLLPYPTSYDGNVGVFHSFIVPNVVFKIGRAHV